MSRKEMSRERIRAWMAAYPEEAAKVRATNRAYAFFRVTGLTKEGEPVGAQGVPLTPGRSIAVDRLHEYGTPFFIEANLPIESVKPASPFRRLMIAQDTGSAIVGPARADLYWGAGDEAGRIAGRIRHPGRFVMLLPRELDMIAAGKEMPLPVPKPKIAALEVAKQDGKGKPEPAGARAVTDGRSIPAPKPKLAALEAAKQDGKGKAEPAGARAATNGRSIPFPAPKPKLAAFEARKQHDKGRVEYANSGARASGRTMPLPVVKPKAPAIEANKQDGKGEAESAGAGEIAAGGKQKPSRRRNRRLPGSKSRSKTAKAKRRPPTPVRMGERRQGRAGKPPPCERATGYFFDLATKTIVRLGPITRPGSLRRPSDYSPAEGARFEVHVAKGRGLRGAPALPSAISRRKPASRARPCIGSRRSSSGTPRWRPLGRIKSSPHNDLGVLSRRLTPRH